MKRFAYARPASVGDALRLFAERPEASRYKAGGVDLIDRLKEHLDEPDRVIALDGIPARDAIEVGPQGLRLGSGVSLAAVADHGAARERYAALVEAARESAAPQIRNQATVVGNLLQRPRCWYFRNEQLVCIKKGGATCYAIAGDHRYHAIFGGGPSFIVHPSNCAAALVAFDAALEIESLDGRRSVALEQFFTLPTVDVKRENSLAPGELVTAITAPAPAPGTRSAYLEVRERAQFDWPLAAVAAVLQLDGGTVRSARIVLGAAAPIPWRATEAEQALAGQTVSQTSARAAGAAAIRGATPLPGTRYKLPLFETLVARAVLTAAGAA
ncbi:MAG TPA: FAD binding domain-containing protein [Acidobacteriota bacterium]